MKSLAIVTLALMASACGGSQGEPMTAEEHHTEAEEHEGKGTSRDKAAHQDMAEEHHKAAQEGQETEEAEEAEEVQEE